MYIYKFLLKSFKLKNLRFLFHHVCRVATITMSVESNLTRLTKPEKVLDI